MLSRREAAAQDRTIDPEQQRFMARRMVATTIEIASGHLSMLSHPAEVASLIMRAAGNPLASTDHRN